MKLLENLDFLEITDHLADGGLPIRIRRSQSFAFNLDFRIQDDENRPTQLNMGWILGYRQQYYNWDSGLRRLILVVSLCFSGGL